MKTKTILPVFSVIAVVLLPLALNAQVFSDLNMNDPQNWNVNASQINPPTPFDFAASWGVSYTSALGVPQDPYSTSTTALQLKVNQTSGEQAGVSVSPISLASSNSLVLSNNFVMTFDMWLNYNSGGFTANSTQVAAYGIVSNSTTATWAGIGNGQLFGDISDNGSVIDYRAYYNGAALGTAVFTAGSQNETAAYYTNLFPSVPVPAGETALDSNQYSNSFPGTVSFQWVQVNVSYLNGILSESINGHSIASYATASVGSDIFLGMYDINNGSSGVTGLTNQTYTLFCNVRVQALAAVPYTFVTIAGSTNNGAADGVGTNALFNDCQGVAVDTNYNVYATDTGNNTIREITLNGANRIVSTIAGTATYLGSSDGTNNFALFNSPEGICVDKAGNLYVADTGNSIIREISPVPNTTNWVTTTLAGSAGFTGTSDGTNSAALFNKPQGIAVDNNGVLYVADTLNHTIRRMAPIGNTTNWVVTTILGSGGINGTNDGTNNLARFFDPEGVAVDASDNLYIADTTNSIIRKASLVGTNWVVTTIAGVAGFTGSSNGTNNNARFFDPGGIAVDLAGNLYVSDSGNQTIRKLTPYGYTNWLTSTIGGMVGEAGYADDTGTNALFDYPKGLCVDLSSNIYIDGNSISEGFALNGGVSLLGANFAQGNQYWINVQLGPPSAVTDGAAWGLTGDPPNSLSSAPGYTRYFTTSSAGLQFKTIPGWLPPTNCTIQIQPGFANVIQTNLYYIALAPTLIANESAGLEIAGTSNTTYRIDYCCTNLNNPLWQTMVPTFKLTKATNQIAAWPPPWPSGNNAPAAFFRAVWLGY